MSTTQQPFQVYPDSATSQELPSHSSSSSHGSYSQVLIVLAIIFVVSIVGCVVGRFFCKGKDPKPKQTHHVRSKDKGNKSSSAGRHNNHHEFQPNNNKEEDQDIEFGFGGDKIMKPIPSAKIAASDGYVGFNPVSRGGGGEARGAKGHVRFPNDIHQFTPSGPMHH